ncbi:nucleotidyltransferase family protein [Algiphilus sp. W345]|uniref:Nucleotidyltransferase family protein n=1 Tax=Banduia mediterranea TaxID=3075609 RepID=A0ABU2WJR5_9GAMM|nr:nucleotidyltransferase family protein [Algiphilus sp. W345]MDT0498097.1 nucleotidyltransferase family protein [Algiphilus sp. W345]
MPERFAVVVLAAGRSRRFGPRNKLLQPHRGRPLVGAPVAAALRSQGSPVIVVTGHQQRALRRAMLPWRVRLRLVFNRRHASGMASSLQRGLAAVPADRDGAVIVLADMPALRAHDIDRLIFSWQTGDSAVVPVSGGRRANPVLLHRRLFAPLAALRGDRGARGLLERLDSVREIAAPDDLLRDIDTPRDWRSR